MTALDHKKIKSSGICFKKGNKNTPKANLFIA